MNQLTQHKKLLEWVDGMARMCSPDKVVWIDGSEHQRHKLIEEGYKTGDFIPLNERMLPGCLYHRSAPNDVARTEHLTYICTPDKEDAGPTNNWMSPDDGYRRANEIFRNSMKGRTIYVIPFSMGTLDSPFCKIGIELTDSIYVVISMMVMTRVGKAVLDKLGTSGEFTKCLHGKADLDDKKRLILHFPQDNTIWSVGSGYGGNALLGKKCLSLRIAGTLARQEGWLAEHMLIMGVEYPDGHIEYIAAALPSACGKTNLAMLVPPEKFAKNGYKVWTVGDDIAWMRPGKDGRLYAVNPEAGFFGVVPGTNSKSNPNAVKTIQKDTIFTNVGLKPDGSVWWEGADGKIPKEALDWRGKPWHPGMKDENGKPLLAAHPNSRFTAPASNCPCISAKWEDPEGVPVSAILFGARRAHTAPLVYQSFNWQHGVFVGVSVASELTAAQVGKIGQLRRDPMAMLPFCGYNMADYFSHWLGMEKRLSNPPKLFHINWFRVDESGRFLWPGFGENLRVLLWILDRCNEKISADKTPVGWIPFKKDIDLEGLNIPSVDMEALFKVDISEWKKETENIRIFFESFGSRLPLEMHAELKNLRNRLESKG
ncbi:MAG: phosphoenolpyruvate carboxykinase (GTP) [Elusimicrobiota bacterium]